MYPRTSVEEVLRGAPGLPDGVQVAMFGSALEDAARQSDVDLLFLYDPARIGPAEIYARLEPFFREIQTAIGRTVHPVVLSLREEKEIGFVDSEGCVIVEPATRG